MIQSTGSAHHLFAAADLSHGLAEISGKVRRFLTADVKATTDRWRHVQPATWFLAIAVLVACIMLFLMFTETGFHLGGARF